MAGSGGCILVEAADGRITHRRVRRCHRWIERDPENRPVRQDRVTCGHIHPVSLTRCATAEIETDPHVAVVRPEDRDRLVFGRILDLIDERPVPERLFRHVLGRRLIGDVPIGRAHGGVAARERFPNPRRSSDEMSATAGNSGRGTIIASRNSAVEKIVGQDEGFRIAVPATAHVRPGRVRRRAIRNTPAHPAAVRALEEAQARTGPDRIDPSVESVPAVTHLPLHRAGRSAAERDRHRAVVLRAGIGLRIRRGREIGADIAGIKFDRVQSAIHVEPRWIGRARREVCVRRRVDTAVVAGEQSAGRTRNKR